MHADHVAGLPGLLHALANSARTEPVGIFGPRGTVDVVSALRVLAPVLPYEVRVTELAGGEAFSLPGGLRGSCAAGEHALPVLGFRVDLRRDRAFRPDRARALGVPVGLWGSLQRGEGVRWDGGSADPDQVLGPPRAGLAIGYITDTRPLEALTALVRGVDLLVCEGTYGSDDDQAKAVANRHMTFRDAATVARDARAGRLWITHFSPAVENPAAFAPAATAIFPATTVASDGLATSLAFPEPADD
jgi:ribonuclease Z